MADHVDFPDTGLPPGARAIPLRGFSGCHVALIDDGKKLYVRKLARDADYNARLLRQAEKQNAFTGSDLHRPVKLHDAGTLISGLAFIDMDYVPGATAAETIAALPLSEIQHWASMLMSFAETPEQGVVDPSVFQAKLADLRRDLTAHGKISGNTAEVIARLEKRDWKNIPNSKCHGDLTLENIIVRDGRLYLIDFLDSFADSWYIDIAKLMQDLIGGWSFRHQASDRNLILRLAGLRNNMETMLKALFPGCLGPIRDLYALNLLRILPYCSSTDEQAFIESRLSAALQNFL